MSTKFCFNLPVQAQEEHWSLGNFVIRVSRDLANRTAKLASPKDIDELITSEINFVKILRRKIDSATNIDKIIYRHLGLKPEEIIIQDNANQITQSWIDWFKHKRTEQTAAIRNIESFLPTCKKFHVYSCKQSLRQSRLTVESNLIPEGSQYRISQAQAYARALYLILCSSQSAPAPGEPLPEDLDIPHLEDVPESRAAVGGYLFADKQNYAEYECYIIKLFLKSAIAEGTTSIFLPLVPVDGPRSLPDDHPINLLPKEEGSALLYALSPCPTWSSTKHAARRTAIRRKS